MTLEEIKRDLDFLPEAMVEEMLSKQKEVIKRIGANLQKLSSLKAKVREALLNLGVIRDFADVVRQKSYPTTVGVDGTRSRIMQISMDGIDGLLKMTHLVLLMIGECRMVIGPIGTSFNYFQKRVMKVMPL